MEADNYFFTVTGPNQQVESAQPDAFGKGCPSGAAVQELFFEGLAGKLAFHGGPCLFAVRRQTDGKPDPLLQTG